jgi:hypothetical protein
MFAILEGVGKWPSANNRLASVEIIGAKISAHDSSNDVSMTSSGDNFELLIQHVSGYNTL